MWAVAVVAVGVAVYIAVPVALAVIYVSRAYTTIRRGIPTASESAWLGLSTHAPSSRSGSASVESRDNG